MEITSIIEIWKWFKWLPNYLLRRIFSKKRLSELIYIDIKPRGDSVRVNLNETSSYEVWLQFINMSPFDVELDRAEFDFNFGGTGVKNKHLRKSVIKSGQIFDLRISDGIEGNKAKVISRMSNSGNESSVNLYCVFNCKLHQFEKDNLHLGCVNVRYNDSIKLESKNA